MRMLSDAEKEARRKFDEEINKEFNRENLHRLLLLFGIAFATTLITIIVLFVEKGLMG